MSNYVVILINKVVEKGEQIRENLEKLNDEEKIQDVNDKFYKIATYCRVRYYKSHTEI